MRRVLKVMGIRVGVEGQVVLAVVVDLVDVLRVVEVEVEVEDILLVVVGEPPPPPPLPEPTMAISAQVR